MVFCIKKDIRPPVQRNNYFCQQISKINGSFLKICNRITPLGDLIQGECNSTMDILKNLV